MVGMSRCMQQGVCRPAAASHLQRKLRPIGRYPLSTYFTSTGQLVRRHRQFVFGDLNIYWVIGMLSYMNGDFSSKTNSRYRQRCRPNLLEQPVQ